MIISQQKETDKNDNGIDNYEKGNDHDLWHEDNPNIASSSVTYDFECIDIKVGDYDLSEFNLTERQYQELSYDLIENVIGKKFENQMGEGYGEGDRVWNVVDLYSPKEADEILDHFPGSTMYYYDAPLATPTDLSADLRNAINKQLKEWFDEGLEDWEPDEIAERDDEGVYEPDDFEITYKINVDPNASGYIEFTDGSEYEW